MESNALSYFSVTFFITWAGLAYLFFNNKKKEKNISSTNRKGAFTP